MPTPSEIKAEIESDPQSLGYKNPDTTWKGDQEIADLMNAITGPGAETITRRLIKPEEIFNSIPYAEYQLYLPEKREYIDTLLEMSGGSGVIDGTDAVVWSNLITLFPQGSQARTNVLAKIQRTGSRAEVLWGEGVTISARDVGEAANA